MKNQAVLKGIAAALLTTTIAVPSVSQAAGRMNAGQAASLFRQCQIESTQASVIMWCGVVDREGKTLLIKATDTGESPAASMATDAWRASIEIALGKAYTAVSVSSDRAPLTSALVGVASGTPPTLGNPESLWGIGNTNLYRALTGNPSLAPDDSTNYNHHGIVTFGGGVPVYDCVKGSRNLGKLIGALGVSGDSVVNDIAVAEATVLNAGGFGLTPECNPG